MKKDLNTSIRNIKILRDIKQCIERKFKKKSYLF